MQEQIRIGSRKTLELQRQRDALDLVLGFFVVLPIVLFVLNGGLVGNQGLVDWLSSGNRLVALVATSLLLIHLLLVARINWIENILGLDGSTNRHKRLGKPIIYLLLLHLLISITHHALLSETNLFTAFVDLNWNYWQIGLASLGLALMVIVAYTSAVVVRKKISYEVWFYIHITSYLAVLIAIPHQFIFGTDILNQPWMSLFYLALYLFVFGSVGWFRIFQPLIQSRGIKVVEIRPEKNNTTSVYVDGPGLKRIPFEAGQFFMLRLLTPGLFLQAHPFSVSSSPRESRLRFTIGSRGDFTAQIPNLRVGTRVVLEGPYGIFSEKTRTKKRMLMIAAGIGVAPVRSLARGVISDPGDVTIIYRVNDANDAALLEELRDISISKGHNLTILDGERSGASWLPGESDKPDYARLIELAPHALESDIYICGPVAWTKSAETTLKTLNVPAEQIHAEEFAW